MRVIAAAASAGGIQALRTLLSGLPGDLDAAVLVVVHLAPSSPRYLPEILGKAGSLPCLHPEQGQKVERARVYIAPPDQHMLVDLRGVIRLSHGPKENRARPAADPLLRSAALAYGPGVIGVILTGYLDDGTAGLMAVKQCGGTTVIQDPADAEVPSMPMSAARQVQIDHQVPLSEMAPLLVRLTYEQSIGGQHVMPNHLKIEADIAAQDGSALASGRSESPRFSPVRTATAR
jgi:two-component system, chemotaxis family, protein-glutamate methylesterase/glutaminase